MQINLLRKIYWQLRSIPLLLLKPFFKRMPISNNIKQILIVSLSRIGDAVYTTPVFREIKSYYKNAEINLICSEYNAGIFKNNPHIREIFVLKKGCLGFFKIIQNIKSRKYSVTIDMTADDKLIGALLARFLGGNYCLGYDIQKRGFCLDNPVSFPKEKLHATQIFLNLLKELKIPVNSNQPEIFITDNEKAEIKDFVSKYGISDQDFIVGLNPGANFPSQRLSEEKWAAFCDIIQEKHKKKVVLFGGPNDLALIEAIHQQATSAVIVIGKLSDLRSAIALIDRCNILLCNNSGPLHIAEALGTPTLSWMGPTIPYRWQPIGTHHLVIRKEVDCAPCNRGICEHHKCETLITIEDLEKAFKNLVESITE